MSQEQIKQQVSPIQSAKTAPSVAEQLQGSREYHQQKVEEYSRKMWKEAAGVAQTSLELSRQSEKSKVSTSASFVFNADTFYAIVNMLAQIESVNSSNDGLLLNDIKDVFCSISGVRSARDLRMHQEIHRDDDKRPLMQDCIFIDGQPYIW